MTYPHPNERWQEWHSNEQRRASIRPFGNALFKLNKTTVHASDPRKQIVICSTSPDIRYATLEEWDKAGKSFGERAQTEGIVTSASPARDKLELFRNLFTGRKDVHAHGYRRKDGGIGYTPACANEWKPGICPKANHHRIKCAECVAAAHSLSWTMPPLSPISKAAN